jgi:hypothetical protein
MWRINAKKIIWQIQQMKVPVLNTGGTSIASFKMNNGDILLTQAIHCLLSLLLFISDNSLVMFVTVSLMIYSM